MHRDWAYFQARLAFTIAAFNVLVQWHDLFPNASGFVSLSIAEFSLHTTNIIGYLPLRQPTPCSSSRANS
jgi:hypothetical protein